MSNKSGYAAGTEGQSPEAFIQEREEGESTYYEAGAAMLRDHGAAGQALEVFSARAGVNEDGDAGWCDGRDDGVGAEAHATMFKGTTGNYSEYVGASGEVFGASAEAYAGDGRAKLGAQTNIIAGEVRLGGDGNQLEAGLSYGPGISAEVRYGEDSDGDGYGEWGARVEAGAVLGVALGFKVEPGKIADEIGDAYDTVADTISDAWDSTDLNPFD
jgi:hypothetical protein